MNPYKKLKLLNYFLLVMLTLLVIFMMLLLAPAWKRIFTERAVYNKGVITFFIPRYCGMEKVFLLPGIARKGG